MEVVVISYIYFVDYNWKSKVIVVGDLYEGFFLSEIFDVENWYFMVKMMFVISFLVFYEIVDIFDVNMSVRNLLEMCVRWLIISIRFVFVIGFFEEFVVKVSVKFFNFIGLFVLFRK